MKHKVAFSYIAVLVLSSQAQNCFMEEAVSTGCVITKKYQMDGEEFLRQFYENDRMLRTTNDYVDWPIYTYWWENRRLGEIPVIVRKVDSESDKLLISNMSMEEVKSSAANITFNQEINRNQTLLADSVLIPIPILSCRDLYYEFRSTAKYSLYFTNEDEKDFDVPKGSVFVMVVSGQWRVWVGKNCNAIFNSGELIYIPSGIEVKESQTKGKFLAVKMMWGFANEQKRLKSIECRPVTLQSVAAREGWSKNTSMAARINGSTLNTGFPIPPIGLGTATLGRSTYEIIMRALHIGYRLFETSKSSYAKEDVLAEREIGEAIADAHVPRGDIFLSIRIPLNITLRRISVIVKESLKNTQSRYIDLILLELPPDHNMMDIDFLELIGLAWNELRVLKDMGKIRSLGMCNINDAKEIQKLKSLFGESLSVVQNWFDQLRTDDEVRRECIKNGIVYMGYGVLGFKRKQLEEGQRNRILESPAVAKLAKLNDVPKVTLLLRWAMLKGVVVTPSSTDEYHLESNLYSTQISLREMDFETYSMGDDVDVVHDVSEEKGWNLKDEL